MSAKKPPRLAGLGRRKKLVVVCLAIVCALIAVGLYAWQSQPVPEAGASVTTAEGKSRQEIQDELDAIVRDNMMTISVAPVAQLQEDGKLRVNVQNVQDNKFPQRFRVIQNDETMYESERQAALYMVRKPQRLRRTCPENLSRHMAQHR